MSPARPLPPVVQGPRPRARYLAREHASLAMRQWAELTDRVDLLEQPEAEETAATPLARSLGGNDG